MEIHVLKAHGLSERQIARKLGISRNTVARYLDAPEAPRYKLRQPWPTKLDAFKSYIARRVTEAPPEWIPVPAMLREQQRCIGAIPDFTPASNPCGAVSA